MEAAAMTATPPEMTNAELAEYAEKMAFGLGFRPVGYNFTIADVLREAARRLAAPAPAAPRVGDSLPREPTPQMIAAVTGVRSGWVQLQNHAADIWRCMYDAALSAPPAASADERAEIADLICAGLDDLATDTREDLDRCISRPEHLKTADKILALAHRKRAGGA